MAVIRDIDNTNYANPPRELIPEFTGNFVRCIAVIDMGTQESTFKGVKKNNPEVGYCFEILATDSEGKPILNKKGEVFLHWTTFTLFMNDKAKLRKFLAGWRGRDYKDDELKNFKITAAAGQVGMGSVAHNPSADGSKIYENLIMGPVPDLLKASIPAGVNKPFTFRFADPDLESLKKVPSWMLKKIKASPEFKIVYGDTDPLAEHAGDGDEFGIGDDAAPPF